MKVLYLVSLILLWSGTRAGAQTHLISEEVAQRYVTAYHQGFSGIFEIRTLGLEAGENLIEIRGIPELHAVERLTLVMDGDLLEARIAQPESSFRSLLQRLSGTRVQLISRDSMQEGLLEFSAGLLALRHANGQYITPDPASHFIRPMEGEVSLFGDSGLIVRVHANRAGTQNIGLLYGTNTIGWAVMHSLRLDPERLTYDWIAEAQLFNNSGMDLENVYLRLFSGDVDVRPMPRLAHTRLPRVLSVYDDTFIDIDAFLEFDSGMDMAPVRMSALTEAPVQVQLEDFFAYDFPEPVLLPQGAIASVQLFHFEQLPYRTKHFLSIPAQQQRELRTTRLAVINEDEAGAIPTEAPPGEVYTSSFPASGMPVFEGNSRVTATPPGVRRYIATGAHVPVRTRHSYSATGTWRETRTETHRIEMTNEGIETFEVMVQRSIAGRTFVTAMPSGFEHLGSIVRGIIRIEPGQTQTFELELTTPAP